MKKYNIPICCDPKYFKLIEEMGKRKHMLNTNQSLEKIIETVLDR
ncbi:MAG: hypothetical protein OXF28_00130 [Thaumarchaeota archaeon]|nr:hypothetical protein [Nitrososphaerota archaeon]MCY3975531.1 hypothetical protein [Nitrososphaerota archaeon]